MMKKPSANVGLLKESIFSEMTMKANQLGAINLSQGFPDFDGPSFIKDYVNEAMEGPYNQYGPPSGAMALRLSLGEMYKKIYGLSYDPNNEITVTNGATEGLFCSFLALLDPGDEVILFEPYYDSYLASIQMVGAKAKPVTLRGPDFGLPIEELEKAFTDKTKLIVLNSPHNPTGKVFSKAELQALSEMIIKHDVFVISDEVYEFLTFDDHKHIPISSLPGMRERTIMISSSGKTFSFTGWKIGWCLASEELTKAIRMVHQFNTFGAAHPLQVAVSKAINKIEDYLVPFRESYQKKREILYEGLKKSELQPFLPEGTFFILCQIPQGKNKTDVEYCFELMESKKVAAIPPSAFYSRSPEEGQKYVRFCFAKKDETLRSAVINLLEEKG
tara:strand:- start:919 stop:2082 length:1164 start_codon:yes stop_codon:yes gene_type:complete